MTKKNKNIGILKFSLNKESLVYFENTPSINISTGVWNPFVFSFEYEDDLISFCNHATKSFTLERMLSTGFIIETYNFMAVDDIIQTGDGKGITIFFKSCAYLN